MQRVHERDLSGHILANELGWTHLCLPAVHEPNHPFPTRSTVKRKATGQIWTDPRQEGEPLWPERFSCEALQRIAAGETQADVARLLNVSPPTISRLAASSPFAHAGAGL